MANITFSNGMWHLVGQSDAMTKLVLLLLFGMSIACWVTFAYKMFLLRVKKKHIRRVRAALAQLTTAEDLATLARVEQGTLGGYIITYHNNRIHNIRQYTNFSPAADSGMTREQYEHIEDGLYALIDEIMHHEESHVWILSTCAALAPLLGLFGTVWGLIHAFMNISERQTADIAVVAPGIAEALITTLAGLLVAIPALLMANYIQTRIRALECDIEAVVVAMTQLGRRLFINK